jgi:hypothetical protein
MGYPPIADKYRRAGGQLEYSPPDVAPEFEKGSTFPAAEQFQKKNARYTLMFAAINPGQGSARIASWK